MAAAHHDAGRDQRINSAGLGAALPAGHGDLRMYVGDTGSQYYFSIEKEAGNQYSTMGYSDPWLTWTQSNQGQQGWSFYSPDNNWVGHWTGVDWSSKLRVLCRPDDSTCPPG